MWFSAALISLGSSVDGPCAPLSTSIHADSQTLQQPAQARLPRNASSTVIAMSVTTTANSRVVSLRHTLAEYDLHHSETNSNPDIGLVAPDPNPQSAAAVQNPPNWDTTHRRVPPYRPVQPGLNNEERNSYANNVERGFIFVMLRGVHMQSVSLAFPLYGVALLARVLICGQAGSHLWRATGEKLTGPSWFRHKVGGEW